MTYQINWQATVVCEGGTATMSKSLTTFGATRQEHEEQADKQLAAIHGFDLRAVGLHNRQQDWEAVFGPAGDRSTFADTKFPDPPKENWFQRMFR